MSGNPNATRTPSGRVQNELGNPPGRPVGPTQHLVPVGPPPTYGGVPLGPEGQLPALGRSSGPIAITPRATATSPVMTVGLPKLNSPFTDVGGTMQIPWTQFTVSLWRLTQPTGIVPGTYAGIVFNSFGQAISASTSGASFDGATLNNATINNVNLTGTVTAPTQAANDNSDNVATTAFVHEQGFITGVNLSGDVTGGGSDIATTVVGLQHRPVSAAQPGAGQVLEWNGAAWAPASILGDAPADGNVYGRQNGTWVVVTPSGGT